MVKLDGKDTNVLTENKGKIGVGIVTTLIGGGVVANYLINDASESESGKAQVYSTGDLKLYVDHSDGNNTLYISGENGTTPYEVPLTQDFRDTITSVLPNSTRDLIQNGNYSIEMMKVTEGKDALFRFVDANDTDNETVEPVSVTVPAADFEKVLKQDYFNRIIKPELDTEYGVDGWELTDHNGSAMNITDAVSVNYLPKGFIDPVHNEEVEDVLGESYSDRMMNILDASMQKYHPLNGSEDNDTRAEVEEARADYLAMMDEVKDGKVKMRITYRLSDDGEEEAFGALEYEDHNMSKAVKLDVYETVDIAADGVLGDNDFVEEVDNFMQTKSVQQEPDYTADSISNIGSLQELQEKMDNWEKETGREVLVFDDQRGLEKLEAAGEKYEVNMTYFRTKMDQTGAKYFKVYDTFDTEDSGAYVAFYGDVQVGLDENEEPIYEETILWDQPISNEMADVIEREFVRGY